MIFIEIHEIGSMGDSESLTVGLRNLLWVFWVALASNQLVAEAGSDAEYWQGLLHFEDPLFSQPRSRIQPDDFFLSPREPLSLAEEMAQTIAYFLQPTRLVERHGKAVPAACKYPLRFLFLNKQRQQAGLEPFPQTPCPDYEAFQKHLEFDRAWLVFSSSYLNSPASAYGHTLLRLERTLPDGGNNQLLDIGVNYAAIVPDVDPLSYALRGLLGGFKGQFSLTPYYVKIREYNDFEARDLWSYRIRMSEDEKKRLVAYLWEVGGGTFPYYFLSENCSYHILYALKMALNEPLLERLPFWVIPADTIKALAAEQRVDAIQSRPSIYRIQKYRRSILNKKESRLLAALLRQKGLPKSIEKLAKDRQVALLDAALDVLDFQYPATGSALDVESLRKEILLSRAKLNRPSPELPNLIDHEEDPLKGHGSARSGLGFMLEGRSEFQPALLWEQRFAYHDLLDPSAGYPKRSVIEFGRLSGRIQTGQFRLKQLNIIETMVLNPLDPLGEDQSWGLGFGFVDMSATYCQNCYAFQAHAQWGLLSEARIAHKSFGVVGAMMKGRLSTSPGYDQGKIKADFEPRSLFLYEMDRDQKMLFQVSYQHAPESRRHKSLLGQWQWRWCWTQKYALEVFARFESDNASQWGGQIFVYY